MLTADCCGHGLRIGESATVPCAFAGHVHLAADGFGLPGPLSNFDEPPCRFRAWRRRRDRRVYEGQCASSPGADRRPGSRRSATSVRWRRDARSAHG